MIEIIKYHTPDAYWFDSVLTNMRNSWESYTKSDSCVHDCGTGSHFELGGADRELAQRLTKSGDDHGKYLRQLPIFIEMRAPNYFWVEFDTYKVGSTRNSTSKMHVLGKYPFDETMFSMEDMPQPIKSGIIQNLNYLRDVWVASGKKKGPGRTEWRAMVQAIPDSWHYTSGWSGSYMNLRHMYFARKNHRLAEWRQFCTFIESLPFSELITVEK